MTTIREVLRRLFRPPDTQVDPIAPDRAGFSYRVFWTKQARGWDAARRRSVLTTARALTAAAMFEPNAFERRYQLEGVDGEHSGASLLSLMQVLEAFDAVEGTGSRSV